MRKEKRKEELRSCKQCGTEFKTKIYNKEFCNKKCTDAAFDSKQPKRQTLRTTSEKISCVECGKRFRQYTVDNFHCSSKCYRLTKARIRAAITAAKPLHVCLNCGDKFRPINSNAKNCSKKCKSRLRSLTTRNIPVIKNCEYCDEEFTCKGRSIGKKYCNIECRHTKAIDNGKDKITLLKYKIRNNVRWRIDDPNKEFKYDIGCSVKELREIFEEKFYFNRETGEVMSWENRGYWGWHIDHIEPLASFDLEDPEEYKKASHYTNLQPMWREDNRKKGSKSQKEYEETLNKESIDECE